MAQKVYLDSDAILYYLAGREPHDAAVVKIVNLIENKQIYGFVSSLIVWNLYYLLSKNLGAAQARRLLQKFRKLIQILPVTEETIDSALSSNMKDFEDAVQYFAFKKGKIDIFISRNTKDYPKNSAVVMTPNSSRKSKIPRQRTSRLWT
ncbi:MAG: PIN domain-containing protein [Spirochaetes bacterium]|nr:PIN domain-containing protein [Spirochaetota bacterium]